MATGPNPLVTSFEFFELPDRIAAGERVQLGRTVSVEGHYSQGLRIPVLGEPSPALSASVERLLTIQDQVAAILGAQDERAHPRVLVEITEMCDPLRLVGERALEQGGSGTFVREGQAFEPVAQRCSRWPWMRMT